MMSLDSETYTLTDNNHFMIFKLPKPAPNPIDTIEIPQFPGSLGLVGCPGTRIGGSPSRKAEKWLKSDIAEIHEWGANGVLTLMEEHELTYLGVPMLPKALDAAGLWWKHLPIMDMHVPEQLFEDQWRTEGADIRNRLMQGEKIIIHCFAGLGRTGLIAARLLVEFGIAPQEAVELVRDINPRRIQTIEQEEFVLGLS